jgi:hypothetical protein
MTGQTQVLSANTSGITGAASVVTGATVLPNAGKNSLLTILGLVTLIVGTLILISFVATKIVNRNRQK